MSDTEAATPAMQSSIGGKPKARRMGLTILVIVVVLAAIVWAVFHFLLAKPEEETDDAYVAGDVVSITARDPGTVREPPATLRKTRDTTRTWVGRV